MLTDLGINKIISNFININISNEFIEVLSIHRKFKFPKPVESPFNPYRSLVL